MKLTLDVAVKQLTLGLGFETGLVDYEQDYGSESNFWGPRMLDLGENKMGLMPPTVFDSLIWLSSIDRDLVFNLKHMFVPFQTFGSRHYVTTKRFINMMQAEQDVSDAGTFLSILQQFVTIHLQGTRDTELIMEDLQNLHGHYLETREFLMTNLIKVGKRLDDLLQEFGMEDVYGSGTLGVLEAMGYPTKQNPEIMRELVNLYALTY